jgi:hypothetical protein
MSKFNHTMIATGPQSMRIAAVFAAALAATIPFQATAGSYGEAKVRSGVANFAAADNVWCNRVQADVPRKLAAQMDCGGSGSVAVTRAGTGSSGGGLFSRLRGDGVDRNTVSMRQNQGNRTRVANTSNTRSNGAGGSNAGSGSTGGNSGGGTNTASNGGNQFTGKYERYEELGLARGQIHREEQSVRDAVRDYLSQNGQEGDWSGFNLP